jgi:hypothetical protein
VQAKRGALDARLMGNTYLVTASALAAYDERRKQARGYAHPDHPLHGKQGPGHRRKAEDRLQDGPTPRSSSDDTEQGK